MLAQVGHLKRELVLHLSPLVSSVGSMLHCVCATNQQKDA